MQLSIASKKLIAPMLQYRLEGCGLSIHAAFTVYKCSSALSIIEKIEIFNTFLIEFDIVATLPFFLHIIKLFIRNDSLMTYGQYTYIIKIFCFRSICRLPLGTKNRPTTP